jgi:hypothetical protein
MTTSATATLTNRWLSMGSISLAWPRASDDVGRHEDAARAAVSQCVADPI